jgi:hypothetical protein
MSTPPSPGDKPDERPSIGDLFPADDLIAQWVFSLTAFAEDLQVGIKPAKEATKAGDLRALLFWQRHMVTRLFEARRLVTSAGTIEEIGEFLGDLLQKPPGGANLPPSRRPLAKLLPRREAASRSMLHWWDAGQAAHR